MTPQEMLRHILDGKKFRHKNWLSCSYCYWDGKIIIYAYPVFDPNWNSVVEPDFCDFLLGDFELYEIQEREG